MTDFDAVATPIINSAIDKARFLFDGDADAIAYCRARAIEHEKKLGRLSKAIELDQKRRTRSLTRGILTSWSGRLTATLRSVHRPPDGPAWSLEHVKALAEKVDPLHFCREPVNMDAEPKGFGKYRPIMKSGRRRRAAQELCADILKCWRKPDPVNYLRKGRGPEAASDRIMELIENHGITHFVLADIEDFFGEVDCSGAREVLPLPGPAVDHAVFVGPEVKRKCSPLYSSLGVDVPTPHEAARPVLPRARPPPRLLRK